jgi:hypothetical protein
VPRLLGRVVEDAFGIAAVALLIVIARMRKTGADRDRPGDRTGTAEAGDAGPELIPVPGAAADMSS